MCNSGAIKIIGRQVSWVDNCSETLGCKRQFHIRCGQTKTWRLPPRRACTPLKLGKRSGIKTLLSPHLSPCYLRAAPSVHLCTLPTFQPPSYLYTDAQSPMASNSRHHGPERPRHDDFVQNVWALRGHSPNAVTRLPTHLPDGFLGQTCDTGLCHPEVCVCFTSIKLF